MVQARCLRAAVKHRDQLKESAADLVSQRLEVPIEFATVRKLCRLWIGCRPCRLDRLGPALRIVSGCARNDMKMDVRDFLLVKSSGDATVSCCGNTHASDILVPSRLHY